MNSPLPTINTVVTSNAESITSPQQPNSESDEDADDKYDKVHIDEAPGIDEPSIRESIASVVFDSVTRMVRIIIIKIDKL